MLRKQNIELIIKKGFRAIGLEVQWLRSANTEESILISLLKRTTPDLVIDVGANVGQYAAGIRTLGYQGRILSFEALSGIHAKLLKNSESDQLWDVAPCVALGSESATLMMNVAGNEASSSLLEMSTVHELAARESIYVGAEAVQVVRLDDPSIESLLTHARSILLKVDTQGYERKVLEGASSLMNRVKAIQLELSLVELYTGAPRIAEMIEYVEGLGFEIFNFAPAFKDKSQGRLLQVDGFFIPRRI
jgi:FkbM family methyltransferase